MTPLQAYNWLTPRLSLEEHNALAIIFKAIPVRRLEGNLVISEDNATMFRTLEEVTGYLQIKAETSLPRLKKVGHALIVEVAASFPKLSHVGGYLDIQHARVSLPELTRVEGDLSNRYRVALPRLAPASSVR